LPCCWRWPGLRCWWDGRGWWTCWRERRPAAACDRIRGRWQLAQGAGRPGR
jgi:hypothetical protein